MAAMEPMALFGLEVPAGDVAITARGDIPAAFRITMAAIDPSAEPEGEEGAVPRATLKIIRHSLLEDDDDEDFDVDEMERILGEEYDDDSEDDDEDDEDLVGGPSDPSKSKKARKAAALKEIMKLAEEDDMDEDDDEELANGVNGLKKSPKSLGKMPLDEDEDSEDDDEDDEYGAEVEEFVICTLDPTKNYQQPLDITIGEDERVLFKVSGTHSIFLTGNYVEPAGRAAYDDYDDEDDDEDEYDLEPDSDEELDYDEEEDDLDDMEDPRIMELDEEEEEAPALVKADKKGKNKRPAQEEEDVSGLDALISKANKDEAASGEKLSKKQLKKQKKNDGSAAVTAEEKEAENGSAKSDKKVQFAKNLEQGPTPTKDAKDKSKGTLGVKKVQGVTIDDKKLGTGPAAKSGDRVSMRYIGKLEKNNKVFDSNKKGKPFTFKLGTGEVIKGWDIGIAGMTVGGERRITIPAHLAYGSKGAGSDIPPNSTLVFDVKLLDVNRGK